MKILNSALLAVALIVISACSTIEGIGKDVQGAGQAIEQEAQKNKK